MLGARGRLEHGAQGIIVSNHGGRSLDFGPSTLEVLPEIVDAVGGRVPVLVDSGFRRGADVMEALALGANAVCLGRATRWGLGAFGPPGVPTAGGRRSTRVDWTAVDALRGAVSVPVLVKGVMTALDATTAVSHGAQGLVVSNYGRAVAPGQPAPLDAVTPIADAVDPQVPVLLDGGMRRGSDVMKAVASGARAVLVARPVMWGLAAYGAGGVQSVIEMLQTELGRVMGCCGTPNLAAITRRVMTIHAPQSARERA